ncbi:unnamed protein product [Thelazia callipaeda]|uniref:Uncharacterized protein n=1 Tax=Thelazia callipaeda TaxID=103827 RepID=A0A0N5D9A8_THECL|nr:unnamed protein product [Thelazia callipaeda]
MRAHMLKWNGCQPPYHKYAVYLVCGFELIISAVSMAIAQKYYELCTILFPIAIYMFDDTKQKQIPDFIWSQKERQILGNHEMKLLLLWCTSTIAVFMAMLLIIPFFFKFQKPRSNRERSLRIAVSYGLAILFISLVLINGAVLIWLFITAPDDNRLFYKLFDSSVKEEIFLTKIEKGLDCISDDDKELDPTIVS